MSKSELHRLVKEFALEQGKTVIVISPHASTKWRRVKRNGMTLDVVEDCS